MLNGKLRMASTCYHVLHLIPVFEADEMNYFYDEGFRRYSYGQLAYDIFREVDGAVRPGKSRRRAGDEGNSR